MTYAHIDCRAMTPNVGAEIGGVDLSNLSDGAAGEIKQALAEKKVVVFRDQDLTADQYLDFMRRFGDPVGEDLTTDDGRPPEVGAIHIRPNEQQTINFWHMDHSFRELPAPILSLYAKVLPDCGGDTLFANLEAAYDGLDEAMKDRIAKLETNHKVQETQNSKWRYTEAEFDAMLKVPPVRHPLVGRNPETGRKYLFVNTPVYCRNIADMETPEGDALLRQLYRHAQRPEYHCRVVWELNTVVVWENVHCVHYPVADYFPQERKLWRIAIAGTALPVGANR